VRSSTLLTDQHDSRQFAAHGLRVEKPFFLPPEQQARLQAIRGARGRGAALRQPPEHSVPMMNSKRHLPDKEQWSQSSGSNVISGRARPGLAGLRPHSCIARATGLLSTTHDYRQFAAHADVALLFDNLPNLYSFSITYGSRNVGMKYSYKSL